MVCRQSSHLACRPPKHSLDFASWSDFPVSTNQLYQPVFVFWPDVFDPTFLSFGSVKIDKSCGTEVYTHM